LFRSKLNWLGGLRFELTRSGSQRLKRLAPAASFKHSSSHFELGTPLELESYMIRTCSCTKRPHLRVV